MNVNIFMVFLVLCFCQPVIAEEHQACHDISSLHPYDTQQLRQIASSCQRKPIADLFYYRAYLVDLMHDAEYFSHLISDEAVGNTAHGFRMYMAMVEDIAAARIMDDLERARFLNTVYENHSEMADLRIRGFDRRAENLSIVPSSN